MKLALNMIVGPGDGELLNRCLTEFDAKNVFDEIVLVLTSNDARTMEVARKFTNKIFAFPWSTTRYPFGNFAGARNHALKNTGADYVMWLDCDDTPCAGFVTMMKEVREVLEKAKVDIYTMDYLVAPGVCTKRERIWRRTPTLYWQFPVHEQLQIVDTSLRFAYLKNAHIVHSPAKAEQASIGRNLQILRHEYNTFKTPQIKFYLAKELYNAGEKDEAVALMNSVLTEREGTTDMMAQAAIFLAEEHFNNDRDKQAETLYRVALSYNSNYAEVYCALGAILRRRKETPKAVEFYSKAMKCQFEGGGLCHVDFYKLYPALALMDIYNEVNHEEFALLYARTVRECDPENAYAKEVQERMSKRIIAKCQR